MAGSGDTIREAFRFFRPPTANGQGDEIYAAALAALDALEQEREQFIAQVTNGRAGEEELRADWLTVNARAVAAEKEAATLREALKDARTACEHALDEFQAAEEHHRWHHEQTGRPVEPRSERLAVLLELAEIVDASTVTPGDSQVEQERPGSTSSAALSVSGSNEETTT